MYKVILWYFSNKARVLFHTESMWFQANTEGNGPYEVSPWRCQVLLRAMWLQDYKKESFIDLLTHIKSIHEGVKFPCEQCDYKATWKVNLLTHIKSIHEGVKFPCEQCDYKATQKRNLLRHIKSTHE